MQSTVFDGEAPCTVEELQNIITFPAGGLTQEPRTEYDEVYPGIYVGEGKSARISHRMEKLGITHILNAAQGKSTFHINTNEDTYKGTNIKFLGVRATDFINCNLSKYFDEAADFIDKALKKRGKVYVHCVQGISRSATLVIAYLMLKQHMTVQDAVRLVRTHREISPNPGFLQQLCTLNEKLAMKGHFKSHSLNTNGNATETGNGMLGAVGGVSGDSLSTSDKTGRRDITENGEDDIRSDELEARLSSLVVSDSLESSDEQNKGFQDRDSYHSSSPCTVEELEELLTEPSGGFMMYPSRPYDQIDNFIFIGEGDTAKSPETLKRLGITHVLNCAHNKGVRLDAKALKAAGITLFCVEALDCYGFKISQFFKPASDFIETAVGSKGKVFVNCVAGASRSATVILAYLMIRRHMTVQEALQMVREKREICPNSDFLQQLCDLNEHLKAAGHFDDKYKKR